MICFFVMVFCYIKIFFAKTNSSREQTSRGSKFVTRSFCFKVSSCFVCMGNIGNWLQTSSRNGNLHICNETLKIFTSFFNFIYFSIAYHFLEKKKIYINFIFSIWIRDIKYSRIMPSTTIRN